MMVPPTGDGETGGRGGGTAVDTVTRWIGISIGVISVLLLGGGALAMLGYVGAVDVATTLVGVYTVVAAAIWVGYILYDLSRQLHSRETQTELSDWTEQQDGDRKF